MNYNLAKKEDRYKFIRRANLLLRKEKDNVALTDESNRTLNQNSYIHVLCRIIAMQTGTTEAYAKQVYFKQLANAEVLSTITKDKITNKTVVYYKSISDLTINELRKAISNFIKWAAENGYYLPEANIDDNGNVRFCSDKDKQAFNKAIISTSKVEQYL